MLRLTYGLNGVCFIHSFTLVVCTERRREADRQRVETCRHEHVAKCNYKVMNMLIILL